MDRPIISAVMRKKALRDFADGVPLDDIQKNCGVSKDTVKWWARCCGIRRNDPGITDAEITAKLLAERQKAETNVAEMVGEENAESELEKRRKNLRIRYGFTEKEQQESLQRFRDFGDPEVIEKLIDFQIEVALSLLGSETTVNGVVKGSQAAILLTQMRGITKALPPITTMKELADNMKMLREVLGMDEKKKDESKGADLRWLTCKPIRGPAIDVEPEEVVLPKSRRNRLKQKK